MTNSEMIMKMVKVNNGLIFNGIEGENLSAKITYIINIKCGN